MTYAELLKRLKNLSDEQLAMTVTIYTPDDEFFPADLTISNDSCDVLDEGHPYFEKKEDTTNLDPRWTKTI